MSKYTTILKRGALIAVALLFAVPIAMLAQQTFPGSNFLLLDRPSVKTNLVFIDSAGKVYLKGPYMVAEGSPFTLQWNAEATQGGGSIANKSNIFCLNSWGSEEGTSGRTTGSISSNRTFYMTCAGLGGGMLSARPVTIGVIDLTVDSILVSKLTPSSRIGGKNGEDYVGGANRPFEIKASAKNIGNIYVPRSFDVTYTVSTNPNMSSPIDINTQFVDLQSSKGLNPGAVVDVPVFTTNGEVNQTLYFQACADYQREIREKSDDNNCSEIKGPYRFFAN